jgi:hypothetical protein
MHANKALGGLSDDIDQPAFLLSVSDHFTIGRQKLLISQLGIRDFNSAKIIAIKAYCIYSVIVLG